MSKSTRNTTGYIIEVSGSPGSGKAHITFSSGATSEDIECAQFFMKMQDEGKSIAEARAYAKIGPMLAPHVDWTEINRVLETF
ncbi:hypothetical protein Brsp07_04633 [Brucella sp. NBRC 14130]|uniref:hypothetical protein n=1 Tax=Brucella sp. NBRC 14130 TaxID=3075483 RepID=UPI00309F5172